MPKEIKTVRWTIEFAASEHGIPREKMSLSLKNAEERPGKDGKFSTRQIVNALYEHTKLERQAKAARHMQQIDDAESARMDFDLKRGNLMPKNVVVEGMADIFTKQAQIIRQSRLGNAEKKSLLDEMRELRSKWEK